jgi:alkanesulfonate monooxygenase SsuD/methylene tetrahydromethanopterin reductase-like flavin-dependent oxidoreductase (luciferase family)
MSRLHVGLTPWRTDLHGAAGPLAAQGERAESLGFDSFWLPESHFSARGALPQPLLLLAAIAARTRKLRLGTTSYLLPVRHPLQVAEDVAVLDRLSEGRVILGIGRGFRSELFTAFEVPPSEKRDRFRSALEQILSPATPRAARSSGSRPCPCSSRTHRSGSRRSGRRPSSRPGGWACRTWPRRSSRWRRSSPTTSDTAACWTTPREPNRSPCP